MNSSFSWGNYPPVGGLLAHKEFDCMFKRSLRQVRVTIWVCALFIFALRSALADGASVNAAQNEDHHHPRALSHDPSAPLRWWKGNLHCHTLSSDGNHYPEMVADWYKSHDYDFLAITDHDVLCQGINENGKEWIDAAHEREPGLLSLTRYRERFGEQWVEERQEDGQLWVRLKPLREFRHLFEEAGRFLLFQGEEITNRHEQHVHINAINLQEVIAPRSGPVLEVLNQTLRAVAEQSERTGVPILAQLNHPNYHWVIKPEHLTQMESSRFFEVYSGHPGVNGSGDELHVSTDRMWDIALAQRLAQLGKPPLFATATDDAHHYFEFSSSRSNPGHGWVMVRAPFLTPEHILGALEAGDFYASTGVLLKDIRFANQRIEIEIEPAPGVTYSTQFIGTRNGYDPNSQPVMDADGRPLPDIRRYSDQIGVVLEVVEGTTPSYAFKGDEIYVRAKVISSEKKVHPRPGETFEGAWTQPFIR
jgi:hypothetical protein